MFPRSMFDTDMWHNTALSPLGAMGPSTLDMFDSFDDLDHTISKNLNWLNKPEFMPQFMMPKVPQKYRITCDVAGYSPKSIKTEVNGQQLTVWAKEDVKLPGGDFSVKEFKKTYELPKGAIAEQLVSFVTGHGQLVVEMPLRETVTHPNADLFPKIVDAPNGGKMVSLKFRVPGSIDPTDCHVTIKDRDLIIKAEHKVERPDGSTKYYYYKRTTMPENTDFHNLKCNWHNHSMAIEAPLNTEYKPHRKVLIEQAKPAILEQKK
jgi:HSP20 family molecular chaperone IbpA